MLPESQRLFAEAHQCAVDAIQRDPLFANILGRLSRADQETLRAHLIQQLERVFLHGALTAGRQFYEMEQVTRTDVFFGLKDIGGMLFKHNAS